MLEMWSDLGEGFLGIRFQIIPGHAIAFRTCLVITTSCNLIDPVQNCAHFSKDCRMAWICTTWSMLFKGNCPDQFDLLSFRVKPGEWTSAITITSTNPAIIKITSTNHFFS